MLQLSSFHSSSTKVLVTNDNIVPCSIFNGKLRWLFKIAQRIFELANTSSREGENISAAAHSFWPHDLKKILSLNSHFWFYLGEGLGTWIQNSKLRGKLSLVWSDSCSLGVLSRSLADLHRAGGMTVSRKMITFFIWRSWNLICREFCRWVDYSDVWHEQPQSFARSFKKKLIDFKLSIFFKFFVSGWLILQVPMKFLFPIVQKSSCDSSSKDLSQEEWVWSSTNPMVLQLGNSLDREEHLTRSPLSSFNFRLIVGTP